MRTDRHLRLWTVLTLSLLLAACGFQLRGGGEWPEYLARIHLGGDGLTPEYERYLVPALRHAGAQMVTDPAAASARLEIVTIDEGQDLLALGVGSTVRDFQLATRIDYRLYVDDDEAPRSGRVGAQRAVQTSAFNVTAALAEARRVQGELRDEAVAALVRRLTAAN